MARLCFYANYFFAEEWYKSFSSYTESFGKDQSTFILVLINAGVGSIIAASS